MSSGLIPVPKRTLTPAQYGELADVPPEIEWLTNITNKKTRRAYEREVSEFSDIAGLNETTKLRSVTRAHVFAWRKDMGPANCRQPVSGANCRLCLRYPSLAFSAGRVRFSFRQDNEKSQPSLYHKENICFSGRCSPH
jgi:hypothetical protein